MKIFFLVSFLISYTINAQVGIGTTNPQATLDVNGNLRIEQVDQDLSSNKILVLGDNNELKQGKSARFYALSNFVIPICQNYNENDTGSFTTTANGTSYTVNWEIIVKDVGSVSNSQTVVTSVSNNSGNVSSTSSTIEIPNYPLKAQRLQVKYQFTPHLPFNPNGFNLTAYNNSNYPDTFSLNYTAADETEITVNITRTDQTSADENKNCWAGQFYFDMMIYSY